jgi:predicted metal-dependent phosphoesterase TrpH
VSGQADLHLHSRHSDGTDEPAGLIEQAAAAGLRAVSLTDHDTLAGLGEALEAGERLGVQVLSGAEISAEFLGHEVHLLAYGFDPVSEALLGALSSYRAEREARAERIVERLNRMGVGISMAQVHDSARGASLGRPHLAEALARSGAVASAQDAFDRYLNPGKPAFVPRARFTLESARQVVRQAGGVLVLAHPHLNLSSGNIRSLVDAGIDGLEVLHPRLKPSQSRELAALAEERGILATGGSDCHGERRGTYKVGSVRIPTETVDRILEKAEATRRRPQGRTTEAGGA